VEDGNRPQDAAAGEAMKRLMVAGVLMVAASAASPAGQPPAPTALDALQFMQGKWVGEGTSELGRGSGYFSFEPTLNGKAWLRRNHSEYPAANGRPAAVHEDLMIVYVDEGSVRAFYTDTESNTIPYRLSIADDKKTVTFVSNPPAGHPRYRLIYVRLDATHMTVGLEMAQADHPDDFKKIVEGRVRKVS
jgi:hypothetical protein